MVKTVQNRPQPGILCWGCDSLSNLDTTDYLKLTDLDRLRTLIDEMDNPLQPVKLNGDFAADEDPLYPAGVAARLFNLLRQSGTSAIRTFQTNAAARSGQRIRFHRYGWLWNSILVKKMPRTFIEFASGRVVTTATSASTYTETTTTVAALGAITRCIVACCSAPRRMPKRSVKIRPRDPHHVE